MATITDKTYQSQPESVGEGITLPDVARVILRPLASLKLTVVLFAMAIFIIWVATLAQSQKDMWDVIHDYFWRPMYSPFAFIELQFLFPYQWLPFEVNIPLSYGFPFPGGSMIGLAMAVNLLAAHLVRFKIQAKGSRLVWGSVITLIGVVLTALVIVSGHNSEGLQVDPPFEWTTLWTFTKIGAIVPWLGLAFLFTRVKHESQPVLSWILIAATVLYGAFMISLFTVLANWYPGDPALRIMWQLTQGGFAGVVILIGSLFLFKKRAGIVVIHLAVGLLLIGESYVSYNNVEERMQIREGEATNFARDIRVTELAVVDRSEEKTERHTVIPQNVLRSGKLVSNEELPFDVSLVRYFRNSDVRPLTPNDKDNPATAGTGLKYTAVDLPQATGADASGQVDLASAYIRLSEKAKPGETEGKEIGVYLVSQLLSIQEILEKVTVKGQSYDLGLRFKRNYKPYSLYLEDVQKNDYIGTATPKDYRSVVKLNDPSRNIERDVEIWMNNPLRYAGETFYQSGYNPPTRPGGPESTDLQVVANTGWMIPYVACMMALIGMGYHFLLTLTRFLNRVGGAADHVPEAAWSTPVTIITALVGVAIIGGYLLPKKPAGDTMNLQAFGRLPVVYQGRTKPLDTLARNTLQAVSDRQSYVDNNGDKQPAIRWLLEVAANSDRAAELKVVRIRNHEVRDMLGLVDTDDDRYAIADIFDPDRKIDETTTVIEQFGKQLEQTHKAKEIADKGGERLSAYQKGLLNLEERLKSYEILVASLRPIELSPIPTEQQIKDDPEALADLSNELRSLLQFLPDRMRRLESMHPPLTIPDLETGEWHAYATEWDQAQARQRIPYVIETEKLPEISPTAVAFHEILAAYGRSNVKQFNTALVGYQQLLAEAPLEEFNQRKLNFESYFNRVQPFTLATVMYLLAFALCLVGMISWNRELNRAAFWLIVVCLVLHTLALIGRIYISGRPPVTNLYSSAVFIGWAGVVLCLVVEAILRFSVGNLLATAIGVPTLVIASYLGVDGDTFTVLQAVLDTNFWLTTHVIAVTLGYATTFVAGAFAVYYLIARFVSIAIGTTITLRIRVAPFIRIPITISPNFVANQGKQIIRVVYGIICFAIFFSFLGTVLGGLWADDSWGRFWGWDPKENGALIIVLWNALILHARWGGMVKDRGLATLAVVGNIVTSWSWFGVNQLGIGLHSYGFTNGVVLSLGLFVLSQLVIMALAAIPNPPIEARPATR